MKYPAFLSLYALLLVVELGCDSSVMNFFTPSVSTMKPDAFATDPVLLQLADAVDRNDNSGIVAAIKAGGDVNAIGAGGFRLLYWAMARSNYKGFEELLKHGASIDADYRDPKFLPDASFRHSVLELVIGSHDTRFLEAALRQGLAPNYAPNPKNKMSLLFIAVVRHSIPAIKTLVAAGADIDWQDASGYTPLIYAGMGRSYAEARVLLESGADPTVRDHHGHDFVWELKQYGSRGVHVNEQNCFDSIVNELVSRKLLSHKDIAEANKPKSHPMDHQAPDITVIEHTPDSEAGQAILDLDRLERQKGERDRR
jgi:hypothetical protein